MAFSYTITARTVMGNKRVVMGTFNSASTTTGSILTGLNAIEFSDIHNKVTEDKGIIDDTTTAGTIALSALTSNDTGTFIAYGR